MAGSPVPPDRRDEVLRGALDQLVAYHLIAQESRARKMGPTDADVDARIAENQGQLPERRRVSKGIAAQGLTSTPPRPGQAQPRGRPLSRAEVSSKIAVTDGEVDVFYKQNLDRFKQAEAVHARHILIGVPADASAADRTKARQTARSVVGQLKRGAKFDDIARKLSTDTGSAQNGGDLGFFRKGK